MKYDPYGVNEDRRPIGDKLHRIFQGETLKLTFVLPDGETVYDPTRYTFTVVDMRFKTEVLFLAALQNYEWIETPEDPIKIQVTIPSSVTMNFRRGSFLYSMGLKAILGDDRSVIEEGSILVEYQAGAPDPDIPYKTPQTEDEDQNYG